MSQIDPAIRALRIRMIDYQLKPGAVMGEAEVSRATWHRINTGGDFTISTLRRLEGAVERLTAARERERKRLASAPPVNPPNEGGTRGSGPLPGSDPQAGAQ